MNDTAVVGLSLDACARHWVLREPFMISRQTITAVETVRVRLRDRHGVIGQGEATGMDYAGETAATMLAQIAAARDAIEAGVDRVGLLDLLPAGGGRFAVDSALWDLEAKQGAPDPFARCGVRPDPVNSAPTITMGSLDAYEAAARQSADAAWLKIKVGRNDPLSPVAAVRRGAPHARLIVDPNQAWPVDMLKALAPKMADLGVALLEQPIPVGDEAGLDGYRCPVPLCADEALNDIRDLPKIVGRFDAINIKLDKVGGLTAALGLADAATSQGLDLMVGCMLAPSLAIAPALVLAQRCRYVDLEAPPLLTADNPDGFVFAGGTVQRPYHPALWG